MFNTADKSKNNFIVGILAMGEGWHNNHHANANPDKITTKIKKYEFDPVATFINLIKK